jgi:hypothetical protein
MEQNQEIIDTEKELKLLHQALQLHESEVIPEGIARLSEIGNASSISVLAQMLCGEKEWGNDINRQIIELLNTMQFKDALPALIEEIGKHIGKRNAHYLIAACWEANYECSKYVKAFAVIASHANAQELIECLSVFENIIIYPSLEDTLFALKQLDAAIEKQTDETLKHLLVSCRELVSALQ